MSIQQIKLMAHLFRRAGFGATRDELEKYVSTGYKTAVEQLLNPGQRDSLPDDLIRRYHVDQSELRLVTSGTSNWLYRMVSTKSPLEEKIALFWHSVFATGERKVNQGKTMMSQIDMFRKYGLGTFPEILIQLSKDPAMMFWLDNNNNHKGAINENYGRELLELFSMGIGNYNEKDIKEASRAFTGWTFQNAEYMALRSNKASIWPYSRVAWQTEYRPDDHDDGEKTFLGQTGYFNGEDIINIIVQTDAASRFVCTRLYQFFVADEVSTDGEELIKTLMASYFDSGYEIRSVLRTLFNSEHFRSEETRFARVKSPAELVAGILHLVGEFTFPTIDVIEAGNSIGYMGQELMNPPSVEGWHEGVEWIDSGTLVERINFASKYLGNINEPGVQNIIQRISSINTGELTPEELVDNCLDLIGPVTVTTSTRQDIVDHVGTTGSLKLRDGELGKHDQQRIAEVLKLIASSREFQLA